MILGYAPSPGPPVLASYHPSDQLLSFRAVLAAGADQWLQPRCLQRFFLTRGYHGFTHAFPRNEE